MNNCYSLKLCLVNRSYNISDECHNAAAFLVLYPKGTANNLDCITNNKDLILQLSIILYGFVHLFGFWFLLCGTWQFNEERRLLSAQLSLLFFPFIFWDLVLQINFQLRMHTQKAIRLKCLHGKIFIWISLQNSLFHPKVS